jgi:hypothetical protein
MIKNQKAFLEGRASFIIAYVQRESTFWDAVYDWDKILDYW